MLLFDTSMSSLPDSSEVGLNWHVSPGSQHLSVTKRQISITAYPLWAATTLVPFELLKYGMALNELVKSFREKTMVCGPMIVSVDVYTNAIKLR